MKDQTNDVYDWTAPVPNASASERVAFDLMRTVLERNYEYYRNPDEILALYCRCANTVSLPESGPAESFRIDSARTLRTVRKVS